MTCNIFGRCGGCQYPHDDYPYTLAKKQKYMESMFGKGVLDIIGADNPYYYRNKVHDVVSFKHNTTYMGKYEKHSHKVLEPDVCYIEDMKAQAINRSVKDLIKSFKWMVYDEDTQRGLVRGSLVRVGKRTGEYLLTIVVTDSKIPSKNNFVKAIRKIHPEIKSIVFNVNDRETSLILGDRDIIAYGDGYIRDRMFDLDFRISSQSFYQVNVVMAEKLYNIALDFADLKGDEVVIDAYCGIGTISLYLAQHCKQVYGVESNGTAIRDAIQNAKVNKIKNAYFTSMDAGDYLEDFDISKTPVDVLLVDPARSGLDKKAKDAILSLEIDRLVYISCNPEELKEDLKDLEKVYRLEKIQPVDMFPWTDHVECVMLLSKLDTK